MATSRPPPAVRCRTGIREHIEKDAHRYEEQLLLGRCRRRRLTRLTRSGCNIGRCETTLRREIAEPVGRFREANRRMGEMGAPLLAVCAPRETTLRQEIRAASRSKPPNLVACACFALRARVICRIRLRAGALAPPGPAMRKTIASRRTAQVRRTAIYTLT